ncbi:hypothetical protein G4B11_000238 [Aspergillus flavus]|nr:hypothetical protein G4B11_000238 [Aspergillus flavus]
MDLFIKFYVSPLDLHRLPVCGLPAALESHLRRQHATHSTAAKPELRQTALTVMLRQLWLDLVQEFPIKQSPGTWATANSLRNHLARAHPETRLGRGGRRPPKDMESLGRPIYCQRFFPSTASSVFSEIQSPSQAKRLLQRPAWMSRVAIIQAQANLNLDCDLAADQADNQQISEQRDTAGISSWLELTQWAKHPRGHSFSVATALASLPYLYITRTTSGSIQPEYHAADRPRVPDNQESPVNEFDLIQISSFL